jgi:hypothetical protein
MFRSACLRGGATTLVALALGGIVTAQRAASQQTPGSGQATSQAAPRSPSAAPQAAAAPAPEAPTEATLGLPIFPGSQYIATFEAGRGQRYILFGSTNSFTQLVAYYRTALKQKGELIFDAPATHMFEIGKFREESMAFPPGVTIKDYTWGGSEGYLNPRPGGQPARFPTIIQFVPVNPADLR